MLRILGTVYAATFAFTLCSGCQTTYVPEGAAPGVRVVEPRAPYASVHNRMNTVNIIDKSLQDWHARQYKPWWSQIFGSGPKPSAKYAKVAVESTNSRRTPTGTLEVWAVIRNRTDHPLQIEGRTQFFDASQAPIENPTAWQRVSLPPNSVATYKECSTRVHDVAYYYIEIREAR